MWVSLFVARRQFADAPAPEPAPVSAPAGGPTRVAPERSRLLSKRELRELVEEAMAQPLEDAPAPMVKARAAAPVAVATLPVTARRMPAVVDAIESMAVAGQLIQAQQLAGMIRRAIEAEQDEEDCLCLLTA